MKNKQMFGLLTIVMVLAVFAALTPAAAADTLSGDRTISPTSVYAEDTFRVTVVVTIDGTVYGPVLNEAVPAGWTITEVDNAGASYSAAETKWIWLDEVTGTKTVIYDVTVPAGTAAANYPVTGTVVATVGGSTIGPFDVIGANQVTVTDDGTATDTLSGDRTISPTSVYAEDTFRVTVVVTIDGTVYGPVLNEAVPAGWTVTEVDNAGASYNAAGTKWIWLNGVTGAKTVIYDVTVPAGTAAANYPVTGTVLATVGGSGIGPFGVTGTNQVAVTGSVTDTITGDRAISPTSLPAGDTFRVTVTVAITGTVYGPVLNEDLPTGWTVTEVDNAGASYSAAETKWIWLDEVTSTKTVIYDVTVPAGTAVDNYPVTGTVLATVGGSTIGPFDVTGVNQVTVTECPCDCCLDLDAGWNLVSVPRMLDGPTDAATVFNLGATELCEYYDGCAGGWSTATPSAMQVTPGRGYMVSKANAEMLCLNFDDSGTAIPLNQQLCADDWNMIGFPSLDRMSVADFGTVTALNGKFTMVWQWNNGWERVSPPDSNNMIPGKGYLLWMTDSGEMPGML